MPIGGGSPAASSGGGTSTLLYTLSLASPGTFDQAGISGAYTDLLAVLTARGTDVGTNEAPYLRFNNDSGANYVANRLSSNANAAGAASTTGASGILGPRIPSAGSTANYFGVLQWLIPGYAGTLFNKFGVAYGYGPSYDWLALGGGSWANTAAITRIQILGSNTANLLTGSTLRIYGLT